MGPDPAVFSLDENESERLKKFVSSKPDELVSPQIYIWLKMVFVLGPDFTVDAIGCNNKIVIFIIIRIFYLSFKNLFDA